jgi:hypothetical protein
MSGREVVVHKKFSGRPAFGYVTIMYRMMLAFYRSMLTGLYYSYLYGIPRYDTYFFSTMSIWSLLRELQKMDFLTAHHLDRPPFEYMRCLGVLSINC